ncbi:PilZ domain-containing protein [Desulfovibrio aminophilus]|uniref:PilZ domain-containing protein n=1 Tax=Desulfovibrio aminophilus TaxID=81425 RepID=UPI0033961D04
MDLCLNRRNHSRVSLADVLDVLRQCDLSITARGRDCDALIEDISPAGACLLMNGGTPALGDSVFFRGCIFNGLIGFLSSMRGVVRWTRGDRCGVVFDEPLELDCMTLSRMVRTEACPGALPGSLSEKI